MEMIHFLHKILPISQQEFTQLLNTRWLNFTALSTSDSYPYLYWYQLKPMDSQFTCSVNSHLDWAAVKTNLRKDFMQISTNPQAQFLCQSGMRASDSAVYTVLCSPLWLKHINILIGTESSEMAFNYSKPTPAVGGAYCWECETEGKVTVHLFRLYCCHYCLWKDIMFLFTCIIIQYCTGKRYSINNAYYENRKYKSLNKNNLAL